MCRWRRAGWNNLPPTDLTFTMLISFLVGCPERSPYLTNLTEEANLDRVNTLPMAYSLDLPTAITFLLELHVSSPPLEAYEHACYSFTAS
jgi:hypothetical protein